MCELKAVTLQILPENQSQNVLSIPSLKNGRYARLAQAVNLLSQVFRHISSCEEVLRLDLDNIAQLERTIFALEHLASFEERERNICCLSSIAICYRLSHVASNHKAEYLADFEEVRFYSSIQRIYPSHMSP